MSDDLVCNAVATNVNPDRRKDTDYVRLRPGMYVGNTDQSGLLHLAIEIVEIAISEVRRGHGSRLRVDILPKGGIRFNDDGRGIPVELVHQGERHTLESFFTTFGSFDITLEPYRSWCGLHRVGPAGVTALSCRLIVEVCRDGFRWRQTFSRGEATSGLEKLGPATKTGTTITFWPDPQIFSCLDFSFIELRDRIEVFAMRLPRLRARLFDRRVSPPLSTRVHCPNGLLDGLDRLGRGSRLVHPTVIHGTTRDGESTFSVAFRWQRGDEPRVWSLCNGVVIPNGGTHVSGFNRGVTRALRRSLPVTRTRPMGWGDSAGEDFRAGIVAIVVADTPTPSFWGATRDRVNNVEFDRLAARLTDSLLTAFFAAHPDEARAIARHLESPTIDPKTGM